MDRELLHELVNRVPERELITAQRFLEFLVTSTSTLPHPSDDEPVTEDDARAIARSTADFDAGRIISHEEVLREFGLR
jgi:hypothetical protein